MKKGIVACLTLSHKNGQIIMRAGAVVTDRDVNGFDSLVKSGHIKADKIDLSKLLKDELQAECDRLKIDYKESDTKAELIELIESDSK